MFTDKWRQYSKRERGFTLFEVVVASFVAILFLLLVLQASTLGSASKAQAQEAAEVLNWLQQDIESVKYQASLVDTGTVQSAIAGTNSVYLSRVEDELQFRTGDVVEFITGNPDGEKYTILSANSPNTDGHFFLMRNLKQSYPQGSTVIVRARRQAAVTTTVSAGTKIVYVSDTTSTGVGDEVMFSGLVKSTGSAQAGNNFLEASHNTYTVQEIFSNAIQLKQQLKTNIDINNSVNLTRCNASRIEHGYADELRDQLLSKDESTPSSSLVLNNEKTKTSKGKLYSVTRVMDLVDIPPYNMLQIRYKTSPALPSSISLDGFVSRVMPDIVFHCN